MALTRTWFLLYCFLVPFIFGNDRFVFGFSRPSHITLENNGYKNVVVAIHGSIPEDPSYIDNLKDKLTAASKTLYTATRKRAFLKEVTILVPPSWTSSSNYGRTTTETLQEADVVISNPIRGKRSLASAKSYRGCGKQGVHVLLTEDFLSNTTTDTLYGKYFVHAWAQFRWGVFQEYADEGESDFYYSLATSRPDSIRCVYRLRGLFTVNYTTTVCRGNMIDPATGIYYPTCKWRPWPYRQYVKASFMDHQWIQEITTFCDDNSTDYKTFHSVEPPNKQNMLCGHRSTWDVITGTDDFKGGINPPRDIPDGQLMPSFVVKRSSRKKRAVVRKQGVYYTKNDFLIRTVHQLETNDKSRHVGLYVYVTKNMEYVPDIQVIANITRPGSKPYIARLHDNGTGADQERRDGIYSRFFAAFTAPGRYIVTFLIYDTSAVADMTESGTLLQIVRGGSFFYPEFPRISGRQKRNAGNATEDNTPPLRISDLRLVRLIQDNRSVILSFTAPGDDMDDGQAYLYKLYTTSHWDGVRKIARLDMASNDVSVESIPVSVSAGQTETITWIVPEKKRLMKGFAFGVLAVDDAGNRADISNVVTAGFVH